MKKYSTLLYALAMLLIAMLLSDNYLDLQNPPKDTVSEVWKLPDEVNNESLQTAYSRLIKRFRPLQGDAAQKSTRGSRYSSRKSRAKKNDHWIFRGTSRQDDEYFAMFQKGKKVQRYTVGQVLPDGFVLQSIDDGQVGLLRDGEVKDVKLYQNGKIR